MKQTDKLKRQRYEISMRIIELESKSKSRHLSKNEEQELQILKKKETDINNRINNQ